MAFSVQERRTFSHRWGVQPEYPFGLPANAETHIPELNAISVEDVPSRLVAFNDLGRSDDPTTTGVHFFKSDEKFLSHLENPAQYSNKYAAYRAILSPDVSVGEGMPRWMRIQRTFQSRTVAATWQKFGHTVVPTLRWADPEDLDFVCHGIQPSSVFAVSRLGSVNDSAKRRNFEQGLQELIRLLQPEGIMIYGATQSQAEALVGKSTTVFSYPTPMRTNALLTRKSKNFEELAFSL